MNHVNNISSAPVRNVAAAPIRRQLPADADQSPASGDKVELSGSNSVMQALNSTTDIRAGKIAMIREQIQNGTYDADGSKLDAATDKVLDAINKQP